MHRTDASGHVANQFSDGDPGVPTLGTLLDEDWLNAVQEEIANVCEANTGLVKGTNTQLRSALYALFGRLATAGTWTAKQTFNAPSDYGITATGAAGFPGVNSLGGSGNSHGLYGTGNGAGNGTVCVGGATGQGVRGVGGSTSGAGVHGVATAGNSPGTSGAGQGSGAGISGTGGATGAGVVGAGGATSGEGGTFTATAGGSRGLSGTGNGTGGGVLGTGGATGGSGIIGVGGATSGKGGAFSGTGTGAGVEAVSGTGAAAIPVIATRGDADSTLTAIRADGTIHMNGNNHGSTVALTNRLAPGLLCKAMGGVTSGSGTPAVVFGQNVASVAVGSDPYTVEVTLASSFAHASNWLAQVTGPLSGLGTISQVVGVPSAVNKFNIFAYDNAGAQVDLRTGGFVLGFTCWGFQ